MWAISHDALNYNIFNKISTVSGKQFPEVYGVSNILLGVGTPRSEDKV